MCAHAHVPALHALCCTHAQSHTLMPAGLLTCACVRSLEQVATRLLAACPSLYWTGTSLAVWPFCRAPCAPSPDMLLSACPSLFLSLTIPRSRLISCLSRGSVNGRGLQTAWAPPTPRQTISTGHSIIFSSLRICWVHPLFQFSSVDLARSWARGGQPQMRPARGPCSTHGLLVAF